MEPDVTSQTSIQEDKFTNLKKVTPLSKYLAMFLFLAMPFIGGWIGYMYAPEKIVDRFVVQNIVPNESLNINQNLSTGSSPISKEMLFSEYTFKAYSTSSGQLFVQGELAPISVEISGSLESVTDVMLRCWKEEMLCVYEQHFNAWDVRQLDFLSIKTWNQDEIQIEGVTGDFPDCSKHLCAPLVTINVDLNERLVKIYDKVCAFDCATNEYLLVGVGDGLHDSRSSLPKPKVSIIDLSF
ncbi:MAG: hypothetical protein R3B53_02655 [Candidatus Paceibacterota bacterium]